jgi:hypothetical protein
MTLEKPVIKPLRPKTEPEPLRPNKVLPNLTFSDGLNFGCGFWVAGFVLAIVAVPILAIIFALLAR